jgi:putative RNA 2'-phosphotransferase
MRGNEDRRRLLLDKYLSKHLRHQPERLGIVLMPGGWVEVDALLAASVRNGFQISRDELEEVVARNDKERFALDDSGTLLRARQGHNASVDLELEPASPPATLYHGTPERSVDEILRSGLLKMRRHHAPPLAR